MSGLIGSARVRTRMYFGLAIGAIIIVVGLAVFASGNRALREVNRAVSNLEEDIDVGGRLAYTLAREIKLAESYEARPSPATRQRFRALGDTVRIMRTQLAMRSPGTVDPAESASRALDLLTQVETLYARGHLLTDLGQTEQSAQVMAEASVMADTMLAELSRWLNRRARHVQDRASALTAQAQQQMVWGLLLFLGMAGVGVVVAVWTLRGLLLPLNVVLGKLRHLEENPVDEEPPAGPSMRAAPLELRRLAKAVDDAAEAQRSLRKAERLSSIGRVVSGIAHELNNPLAAILLATEDLRSHGDADQQRAVETVAAQAERAQSVVRRLLTVARPPQAADFDRVDPIHLVDHACALVETSAARRNVEILRSIDLQDARVTGHAGLLTDCLVNVLDNAVRASPEGGTVTVAAGLADHSRGVRITVSDEGPGIDPDHLSRVFEPFFTTRAPGVGTGLGLAVTHRVIEEHRGDVSVRNRPEAEGGGAEFVLTLPLADAAAAEAEPEAASPTAESPAAAPGEGHDPVREPEGRRRILVVEDEAALRGLVQRIFERKDWDADVAANGREALERLRSYSAETRRDLVVVSDLKMPEMDGMTLHRMIAAEAPDLARRFVFMTGDNVAPTVREFLEATDQPVVEKPFGSEALVRVVEDL